MEILFIHKSLSQTGFVKISTLSILFVLFNIDTKFCVIYCYLRVNHTYDIPNLFHMH